MRRRDKYLIALVVVVALLVAIRAAMPWVVKDYVNDQLHALKAYDGSVEDIDLSLWRGAYQIDGLRIVKTGAGQPTPFFSSDHIDLSIEWRSLFKGSLVATTTFFQPKLNLVQARSEQESQLGKEENWRQQLEELFPFRFNTVEVRNGIVTFRAPGIQTEDALTAERVNGIVSNLTNVEDRNKETFADFRIEAAVLDNAPVRVAGSVDPLARQPTFDVNLTLEKVQLPQVNPWLRRFLKADAESGDFQLYMEIAAADGGFKGYAKPILQNVNFLSSEEPEDNPLRRLWEGIVDFAANIFENKKEDQVAARIPFSGTVQNPDASIVETIVSVLRNAFVGAFARSLENSISIRSVRKELENVDPGGKNASQKNQDKDKKDQDENDEKPAQKPGPRANPVG